MSKKVTTAQIAKLAGVSLATVSRALNPKQSWRISKEKRDKIRTLAHDLGFTSCIARKAGNFLKTFRVAMLLGRMDYDLVTDGNVLLPKLCDILQASGYTLQLIKIDFSSKKLVASVRNILRSDSADVYVIGGGLLNGQSLELLRKLSSRLILLTNYEFPSDYPDFHWLSYFERDPQSALEQALEAVPSEMYGRAAFLGNNNFSSQWKIKNFKKCAADLNVDLGGFPAFLFGDGSFIRPENVYRSARRYLKENFDRLKEYQVFFCGGRCAFALYDELVCSGKVPGKDFFLLTYYLKSSLLPPLENGINFICRNLDREAEILCEQILRLVDDPTPQRNVCKWSFIPAQPQTT